MAEHDLKGDKLQINSIESKEIIRIAIKTILSYSEGFTLGDFDLIHKKAVEDMIAATPGLSNRFPTIILTDDNDNEIGRITTDKQKLIQLFSVNGELLLQLGPSSAVTPPVVIPPDLTIPYTLSENQPDFLDLNFAFRAADGSVLSDNGNEGSGFIGDGGVKPKAGELLRVELAYFGGLIDSSDNLVSPWDGPVKVTLEIRKNGIFFDGFVKLFPTPPPVGSLGYKFIQPDQYASWTCFAKAERYTPAPGDSTSEVLEPPVAVATISMVGGTDVITGGLASFILDGSGSYSPSGGTITYLWSSDDPDVTFSAP